VKARAPGKVVLSGAYSVLHGAPAVVSAVSRYVLADSTRAAELVTEEVRAALRPGQTAPWFDASDLREGGRKLGLGSSAAILAASLYALERGASASSEVELRQELFERGLAAHRAAQGGGSGVDVAASVFGGTLVYRLPALGQPELTPCALPPALCLEVWTCPTSASTRELLGAVAALGLREPTHHRHWLDSQGAAATAAATSLRAGDAAGFVAALRDQLEALSGLGRAAGVPIVTPELAELAPDAREEGGVLLPAGAGGGDIALFVGAQPSSVSLRSALGARQHHLLPTSLSAPGVGVA
jgi:phosphomevalonate kinase